MFRADLSVSFPALIESSNLVVVTKTNGVWDIELDYTGVQSLPSGTNPANVILAVFRTDNGDFASVTLADLIADAQAGIDIIDAIDGLFATDVDVENNTPLRIMDPPHTRALILSLTGSGTSINADVLSAKNVVVTGPALSTAGNFVVDGQIVTDTMRVFLDNQTNPVETGVWQYVQATNMLIRPPDFANGLKITQPFYVTIALGDNFSGLTYGLTSPLSPTIGVDGMTWSDTENSGGLQAANTFVGGAYQPFYTKKPALPRHLVSTDVPPYRVSLGITSFAQTLYINLNNYGRISRYIQSLNPWSMSAAVNQMITEHNVCEFDRAVICKTQISAPLSGKRLIFLGSGMMGPNRVFMDTMISSFLDISGTTDLRLDGDLTIEYIQRASASIKAIKSSSTLTRFRADRILTKGVDFGLYVGGAMNGFTLGSAGVNFGWDPTNGFTSETPLYIASSTTGLNTASVTRIEGILATQTAPANVNYTFVPFQNSSVQFITGTQTANRTISLSLQNAVEGYRARFVNSTPASAFSYAIGGLKTITTGQSAEVVVSNGAWVLIA